jgi:hypothetical protein
LRFAAIVDGLAPHPIAQMPTQPIRSNPVYPFLLLMVLSGSMGFQAWRTMINNFAYEVGGLNGFEFGIVQSVREIPGFLVFLVVFLLLIIKEHRLGSLSVIVLGIGVATTGLFPSLTGILVTTLVMSTGMHYYETINKSLTLQHFSKRESPLVLAQVRAYQALGNIAIGGVVIGFNHITDYQWSYLIIGLGVVIAGGVTIAIDPIKKEPVPQHKKIILRKEYWLFYVLNLLSGARRQIFVVFAVFLLVQRHNFSLAEVAGLFILNNILSYFLNPWIGKAINRFGERKVLSLEYVGLVLVFSGYVFLENRWLVAGLYLADHIFFNFSIGISTYLHKIADPRDIAPSNSVGFAINHIAAVFIPFIGGWLWLQDYRIPFAAGAALSVVSLLFVQFISSDLNTRDVAE